MTTSIADEDFAASTVMRLRESQSHGGDLDQARRCYPAAPAPWIDLSTGINAVAYPVPPLSSETWSRLPLAEEEQKLRQAAAYRYGVRDSGLVVTAPGTQALIQVLPTLMAPTEVAVLGPTYSEHARCWERQGHTVTEVATLHKIETAQVVVVVNPNNPTGRLLDLSTLLQLAENLAARRGILIVDEAFIDLLDRNKSIIPHLPPSTIVLRSFGKTYGLAGLRLGFAIAELPIAARLRGALGPWAASGPALVIGRQALNDDAWIEDARDRLLRETQRLDTMLDGAGCTIFGGTPLFRLVAHRAAQRVTAELANHGIHIRRFAYEPTWLRLGIPGADAEWERLETALRSAPLQISSAE